MSRAVEIKQVAFYGKFEFTPGTATPKYVLTKSIGDYKPIEALIGRYDNVAVFLAEKTNPDNADAPTMRLQGKNSVNISGLKNYFVDGGKVSRACYGTPPKGATYGSKKPKPNPFADNTTDGFIFLLGDVINVDIAEGKQAAIPKYFEWLVLPNANKIVSLYVGAFAKGGYVELIEQLRGSATDWQR